MQPNVSRMELAFHHLEIPENMGEVCSGKDTTLTLNCQLPANLEILIFPPSEGIAVLILLCVFFLSSCKSHKMLSLSSRLPQSSVRYLSQHRFTFRCQIHLDYLYPHSVSASLRAEKHRIKSVNQWQTYKMQNKTKMATLLCSLSCHGCYRYKFTQDGGIRFTQSS